LQEKRCGKANGRIRTDNPRFTKPESENANQQQNQALTEGTENVLASCLALLAEKDPDLGLVVKSWPNLPAEDKIAILKMVENTI
jgi:hypothetical protein